MNEKKRKRELDEALIDQTNENLIQQNNQIKRNIIYVDPCWQYEIEKLESAKKKMKGMANSHYSTMSLEQLKQLKVQEIAAKDCLLFMWTTGPQMKNS